LSRLGVDAMLRDVPTDANTEIVTSSGARAAGEVRLSDVHGARLLVSDVRVAFLLLNEARYRTLTRLLGIPRDQANVATFIGALIALEGAQRAIKTPSGPSRADVLLGAGAAREALRGVAGRPAGDAPLIGTLLMIAIIGKPVREAVVEGMHGARGSMRKTNVGFRRRYGYLFDPGHLRERRARSRGMQVRPGGKPGAGSSTDRQ
jgi:hypothetical protein